MLGIFFNVNNSISGDEELMEYVFNSEPHNFLSHSFFWSRSRKGYDFWDRVDDEWRNLVDYEIDKRR